MDHLILWTIGPDEADQRWDLAISSRPGHGRSSSLSAASPPTQRRPTLSVEPNIVDVRNSEGSGEPGVRADLWLPPGRYLLSVGPGGPWTGAPKSYQVGVAAGTPLPASADHEPNDDATLAVPVAGPSSPAATRRAPMTTSPGRCRTSPNRGCGRSRLKAPSARRSCWRSPTPRGRSWEMCAASPTAPRASPTCAWRRPSHDPPGRHGRARLPVHPPGVPRGHPHRRRGAQRRPRPSLADHP